jgi:hypothetical protein
MPSISPGGATHQAGRFSPDGRRPELRHRWLRLTLPALLAAMALAACGGSTASLPPTAIPLTAATTSPTTSPLQSEPVTTSAPAISPGGSPGGPCPSADAVNAALSVKASIEPGGLTTYPGSVTTPTIDCQYKYTGYGDPVAVAVIGISFYQGLSAAAVSQLMQLRVPGYTYTSVAGVGDQAETVTVSSGGLTIEGINAARGTTVIEIVIYGTIPLSLVESFTNQLF